jgi:hypothetical protein
VVEDVSEGMDILLEEAASFDCLKSVKDPELKSFRDIERVMEGVRKELLLGFVLSNDRGEVVGRLEG